MFKKNYHTHTKYCNHASGEIREYVDAAIRAGLDTIGFSCHAPYDFGSSFRSWYRMEQSQTATYVSEILEMKAEYADKIDVKLGFEAEYYPDYFDSLMEHISQFEVDYLILGQHFTKNELDGEYMGETSSDPEKLRQYVAQVKEAIRSGKFTYVAHPDLPKMKISKDEYNSIMSELCEVSLETGVPLEINLLGISDNRNYPNEDFLALVGKYGCNVVIGADAHRPDALLNHESYGKALKLIEKYKLNYTDNDCVLRNPWA